MSSKTIAAMKVALLKHIEFQSMAAYWKLANGRLQCNKPKKRLEAREILLSLERRANATRVNRSYGDVTHSIQTHYPNLSNVVIFMDFAR